MSKGHSSQKSLNEGTYLVWSRASHELKILNPMSWENGVLFEIVRVENRRFYVIRLTNISVHVNLNYIFMRDKDSFCNFQIYKSYNFKQMFVSFLYTNTSFERSRYIHPSLLLPVFWNIVFVVSAWIQIFGITGWPIRNKYN